MGFALTEAIASFALFFASKQLFFFSHSYFDRVKVLIFIQPTIFLKQIVHSAHSIYTGKANSCFHSIFITKMYHVTIRCSNQITLTLWKFLDCVKQD